jgi:hypothetical protein
VVGCVVVVSCVVVVGVGVVEGVASTTSERAIVTVLTPFAFTRGTVLGSMAADLSVTVDTPFAVKATPLPAGLSPVGIAVRVVVGDGNVKVGDNVPKPPSASTMKSSRVIVNSFTAEEDEEAVEVDSVDVDSLSPSSSSPSSASAAA